MYYRPNTKSYKNVGSVRFWIGDIHHWFYIERHVDRIST